MHILFRQ